VWGEVAFVDGIGVNEETPARTECRYVRAGLTSFGATYGWWRQRKSLEEADEEGDDNIYFSQSPRMKIPFSDSSD